MASGFMQRFKGKIVCQSLWMASGNSLVDAATGVPSSMDYIQRIALPVTAVATTLFTTTLPPGRILQRASVYTTTAYTGATVTIALGVSSGDGTYVAATTIKALGIYSLTLISAAAASIGNWPTGSPNLWITVAQGTPTAVGAATLVLEYA